MLLLTGPAGSGKTTTIYACLRALAEPGGRHIITIEDPVEQIVPGVMQTEVNEARGLDFAKAARHLLRQDPQAFVIGEIRDEETANIAVRAALTGHLVISTLHAGSCQGVLERLLVLCADRSAIAAAVELVLNQRLMRRLCRQCRGDRLRGLPANRLPGPRPAGRMAANQRRLARANPRPPVAAGRAAARAGGIRAAAVAKRHHQPNRTKARFRLMKNDEFSFFNQQLAAMVRDGIPLESALRRFCADMRRGQLRSELEKLEADLAKGSALARGGAPPGNCRISIVKCSKSARKATISPPSSPCWPTITSAATSSGPGSKG